MRKKIIYITSAALAFCLASCSDNFEDASKKHVYGEGENPYLRADVAATINIDVTLLIGQTDPLTVDLTKYAETIQSCLGMTVSEMVGGVGNGRVAFHVINAARGNWDTTAPNKGANGYYLNSAGGIGSAGDFVTSIELDPSDTALKLLVSEGVEGGAYTANVGFAVKNGINFDQYVRFRFQITVKDPTKIMLEGTIPEGDYNTFGINFEDHKELIEVSMGMSFEDFSAAVLNVEGDMALYMVDASGAWIKDSPYTANGLGFWCNADGKPIVWGSGCLYFVETYSDGAGVSVGRYTGIASGTKVIAHFVYASKSDPSKYIEFIINATFA